MTTATATKAEPCVKCGKAPRLGSLSRCKACLQADAAAACSRRPKRQSKRGRGNGH